MSPKKNFVSPITRHPHLDTGGLPGGTGGLAADGFEMDRRGIWWEAVPAPRCVGGGTPCQSGGQKSGLSATRRLSVFFPRLIYFFGLFPPSTQRHQHQKPVDSNVRVQPHTHTLRRRHQEGFPSAGGRQRASAGGRQWTSVDGRQWTSAGGHQRASVG